MAERAVEAIQAFQLILGLGKRVIVKAHHDQPCLTDPALKSVVTEPVVMFEEPVPYEKFADELMAYCKDPLLPMEEMVLKSCEITDIDEDSFYVKVVHDGEKWKRFGVGNGQDVIRQWCKMTWDRKTRQIWSEDYKRDPDDPRGWSEFGKCCTRFTDEVPFRIEFWNEQPDGTRYSGEVLSIFLSSFYVNPILMSMSKRTVEVEHEVDSPTEPGKKSVLSSTLDGIVSTEEVIEGLLDDVVSAAETQKLIKTQVDENEWEFVTDMTLIPKELQDQNIQPRKMSLIVERDEGRIVQVGSMGNELLYTNFVQISNNPLRVETWMENGSERLCGKTLARKLRDQLNTIVSKAEGGWFW